MREIKAYVREHRIADVLDVSMLSLFDGGAVTLFDGVPATASRVL